MPVPEAEEAVDPGLDEKAKQVASWSASHAEEMLRHSTLAGLGDGMHVVPLIPPDSIAGFDIANVFWTPPATKLAEKVLNAHQPSGEALRAAWEQRHTQIRHKQCRPLEQDPRRKLQTVTPCYNAGYCMCDGRAGRPVREIAPLATALSTTLQRLVGKGGRLRSEYDRQALILRITHEPDDKLWFHVGHGNLNTLLFTLLSMVEIPDPSAIGLLAHGGTILRAGDPVNMYEAMQGLSTDKMWDLDFWQVDMRFCMAQCEDLRLLPGFVRVCLTAVRHEALWRG